MPETNLIPEDTWKSCLKTLRHVITAPESAPDLEAIERLAAKLYKHARKRRRKEADKAISAIERQERQEQSRKDRTLIQSVDNALMQKSVIPRIHQGADVDQTATQAISPEIEVLGKNKQCYCCGARYRKIHFFYHRLCPECARFNYAKRLQRIDLTGRYALVTGGRIKIGFHTALKLLRDGATVMITTRFPKDAAERYAKLSDYQSFRDRLKIQGLDFLHLNHLVAFVHQLETWWPALDILVNNAAQTVWRPPAFYEPALKKELDPSHALNYERSQTILALNLRQERGLPLLPCINENPPVDRHGQLLDKRERNSWTLRLHELDGRELLEVLLINTAAPCLLTAKLKPLLIRSVFNQRFIINVGGLDGQFNRLNKTDKHPHVNMSKAGLNMMTRTAAADYAQDGIFMNSVDTGWITHEGAYSKRKKMAENGFVPPLDEVDGASRIYDIIVQGIQTPPEFGKLFRNYRQSDW